MRAILQDSDESLSESALLAFDERTSAINLARQEQDGTQYSFEDCLRVSDLLADEALDDNGIDGGGAALDDKGIDGGGAALDVKGIHGGGEALDDKGIDGGGEALDDKGIDGGGAALDVKGIDGGGEALDDKDIHGDALSDPEGESVGEERFVVKRSPLKGSRRLHGKQSGPWQSRVLWKAPGKRKWALAGPGNPAGPWQSSKRCKPEGLPSSSRDEVVMDEIVMVDDDDDLGCA